MSIFDNIKNWFAPKPKETHFSENAEVPKFLAERHQQDTATTGSSLIRKLVTTAGGYVRASLKDWNNASENAEHPSSPRRNELYDIYKKTMRDLHTKSEVGVRKLRVRGHPYKWTLKGKDFSFTPGGWFFKLLNICLDTILWGHSLIEFDIVGREVTGIRLVPRAHVVPEQGIILVRITDRDGLPYRETDLGKYVLEIDTGDFGLLYEISNHNIRKTGMERAWLEFGERFGLPIPYAKSAIANPAELAKIDDFLSKMGNGTWGRFPEGVEVDFIESQNTDSYGVFLSYIRLKNEEITKAVLGQTMLTNDNGTGSYSKAEVSERVADDILKDDKLFVGNFINNKLIPFLTRFGIAPEGLLFEWDDVSKLPIMEQWKIDQGLMQLGYTLPVEYLSQQYGAPVIPPINTPIANFRSLPFQTAQKEAYTPFMKGLAVAKPAHRIEAYDSDAVAQSFEKMLLDLYEGRINKTEAYTQFADVLASTYHDAVQSGYGAIQYGMKDVRMLSFLTKNLFLFSGAKSYGEITELRDLLTDDAGNPRGWNTFKKEAQNINNTHNLHYLRTEYNQAVASAQMASKWVQIRLESDVLPLLQYEAINDERTRAEHEALDGIVRPIRDTFWQTHYPPNGWGCRCSVRQLAEGEAVITKDLPDLPSLKPIFKNNVGINGIVFPQDHPYISQIPKGIWSTIADKMGDAYEMTLYKEVKRNKNGNHIEAHPHHDKTDYAENMQYAQFLMGAGYNVRIRPHSFETGVKNPEAWVQLPDGEWVLSDFKTFKGTGNYKSALQGLISAANKQQANMAVIDLRLVKNFSVNAQKTALLLALSPERNKNITEVMLIYPETTITISRNDKEMVKLLRPL